MTDGIQRRTGACLSKSPRRHLAAATVPILPNSPVI